MHLRNVGPGDAEAYVRMRCDEAMMAELGGPLPREQVEARLRKDLALVAADSAWIKVILLDGAEPGEAAGLVTLWQDEEDGATVSEIGWMVLPEFQGRGLAKAAVRQVLDAAAADGRWGEVHANPGVTNGPSNGICRSLGFRLLGERDLDFADRVLRTNHWVVTPGQHDGSRTGS
ncbi:GNAT family N-acetyltransferase [Kitasatospora cathayae]|uniref:GNAT family N-acetyltransferase n=1 Tax=Kitasatospora cathayae TaxID=3004092 RepID=A0ABY7Q7I7_9ACTN|nr:GNAT family N-acetyltransferase [Kitasatospora sp. HUAS 3-15]WBP88134.1 GNAT family N-acetyltransferase [Kitasatospora sp. HUAS 3-15]